MGQIIDLLSNLFKLTKVAAVTLPGLAAAGVLALLLWLPPVDLIPIAEPNYTSTPEAPAKVPYVIKQQMPCPTVPGADRENCVDTPKADDITGMPACDVDTIVLSDLDDCNQCVANPNTSEAARLAKEARKQDTTVPKTVWEKLDQSRIDVNRLLPIADRKYASTYIHEPRARQQYLLDSEKDVFASCAEVEDAWKGVEEQENTLLAADLTSLEKQRTDLQDAYLTSLKANNPGAARLQQQLQHTLDAIEWTRERNLRNSSSIKERERRSAELKRRAAIIAERLTDPERLRPRRAIDDYLSGLVNHVVAFILLALALSLVVTALDRAIFDSIYEVLFTSSRRGPPSGTTTAPMTAPTTAARTPTPPVGVIGTNPRASGYWRKLTTIWRKVEGWDMYLWIAGVIVIAILCWVLHCQPGYIFRRLLAAMIACFAGIAFGHWWVRLQQDKGDKRKFEGYSTWKLLSFAPAKFESLPVAEQVERPPEYEVDNLGFFNRRLATRDLRLLLTPEQLEQRYEEEQKRLAQEKEAAGETVSKQDITELGKPQTPPPQVLQPRYAIGKGIITQDEYQNLKDTYFAQSELSFGLIVPLFLLVFALGRQEVQLCLPAWLFCALLWLEILLTFALFWAGMERQEKFGMEFRLLILGHWDKLNEAAAQTAASKPDLTPLREAVEKALEKMQMQFKPFVVELRKESGPSTGSGTQSVDKPPQSDKPGGK